MPHHASVIASPLGLLRLESDGEHLTCVAFDAQASDATPVGCDVLERAAEQLIAYFEGRLQRFDVPLAPQGTAFQQEVWTALAGIPWGTTTTYGALAAGLGKPDAVRAVGAANGRNPIAILIPCHRVIGTDGELTGYAGGLERKRALLRLEGVKVAEQTELFG